MKRVMSTVCSNCFYALRSADFWGAVGLYLLIVLLISVRELDPGRSPVYYTLFVTMISSTTPLILICAIPRAGIFAREWCSGRFIYSVTRIKKRGYAAATVLSAFSVSAMVSVIGMTLHILILSFTGPLTCNDPTDSHFLSWSGYYANGGLLVQGHTFAFYFLVVLIHACCMGFFSACAVVVSVIITSPYAAAVSSMVLYVIGNTLARKLNVPGLLVPQKVLDIMHNNINLLEPDNTENFSVLSMLYPYAFLAVWLVILIIAAHFLIKRKYDKKTDLA